MKMVLASRNRKKIAEMLDMISEYFDDAEILSLDDVGLFGEIEENGTTFEENALIKARRAAESGLIGIGEDSGLCIDALNGEPGIYSARYAGINGFGDGHDDESNNRLVLQRLERVPDEKRTAYYVSCIACRLPDGREFTVRGRVDGKILREYRGNGGFGYDPLFYYEPAKKTFAEMSGDEKNAISHRRHALTVFAKTLKEYLKS